MEQTRNLSIFFTVTLLFLIGASLFFTACSGLNEISESPIERMPDTDAGIPTPDFKVRDDIPEAPNEGTKEQKTHHNDNNLLETQYSENGLEVAPPGEKSQPEAEPKDTRLSGAIIMTNLPKADQPVLIFLGAKVSQDNVKTFEVWNAGDKMVTLTAASVKGADLSIFKVEHPKLPVQLAPGSASITFKVTFHPKQAGEYQARLGITSNDADNVEYDGNFYIELTNKALVPVPELTCSRLLFFGKVPRGKSTEKTCEVKNVGQLELEIRKFEYKADKGADDAFAVVAQKPFPIQLKPGGKEKANITIRFTPTKFPPAESSGFVFMHTNIKGETSQTRYRIKVAGTISVPVIQLVPDYPQCRGHDDCRKIDSRLFCTTDTFSGKQLCMTKPSVTPILRFPQTLRGEVSKRTFQIRSTGDLPLVITKITLGKGSKDYKVQHPTFPLTLRPRASQQITVSYSPADSPGSNTLEIHSNAGNLPKAILSLE